MWLPTAGPDSPAEEGAQAGLWLPPTTDTSTIWQSWRDSSQPVRKSSSGHSAPSLLATTFLSPLWPHLADMGAQRIWQPAQAQSR